jgi:alkylation response protein AidB-like acyl-CoA dehydrogenase
VVGMDFKWTKAQTAFRNRVRTFIDNHLPTDWEILTEGLDVGSEYTVEFARKFCPALAKEGLLVPHWPAQYGGQDGDPWSHWILNEEMLRSGEPRSYQYMSVNWAGPGIIHFGTEAQKADLLPKIAAGSIFVCQGFSEPSGGSDLAALRTSARQDGNDWIISGQKIWTSAASFADICILLARTGGPGSKGISCFLVPMDSPGIQVRVVKGMMGARSFHEVFFDGVRVPNEAMLGGLNQGWPVVITVMHYERIGIPRYLITQLAVERCVARLKQQRRFDELAQLRAAKVLAACEAARLQCYKVIDARVKGHPPSAETSLARVGIVMADRKASDFITDYAMDALIAREEPLMAGAYRRATASGIAAGTLEIQLDLISRTHLELPRGN